MCIYTVGSLWGPWTNVLIIEVSIFHTTVSGVWCQQKGDLVLPNVC